MIGLAFFTLCDFSLTEAKAAATQAFAIPNCAVLPVSQFPGGLLPTNQNAVIFEDTLGRLCLGSTTISAPSGTLPVNDGGSITAGGTSQLAILRNVTRKACLIENPATAADEGIATPEPLFVNFTNPAAIASTSVELSPGQSMGCNPWGNGMVPDAVNLNATTTGHKFIAFEFQ